MYTRPKLNKPKIAYVHILVKLYTHTKKCTEISVWILHDVFCCTHWPLQISSTAVIETAVKYTLDGAFYSLSTGTLTLRVSAFHAHDPKQHFKHPFFRTWVNLPKRKIGQNLGNTVIGRTAKISQKMKYFPWTSDTHIHTHTGICWAIIEDPKNSNLVLHFNIHF